jgi:hypothetical protein
LKWRSTTIGRILGLLSLEREPGERDRLTSKRPFRSPLTSLDVHWPGRMFACSRPAQSNSFSNVVAPDWSARLFIQTIQVAGLHIACLESENTKAPALFATGKIQECSSILALHLCTSEAQHCCAFMRDHCVFPLG